MPALRTEFSTVLLYDPDKSRSTVHCFAAQPTPLEERTMGRLFLVVEIDAPDAQNQQLIDEIQRVVTAEYYGSENFQVESAFERALQKTNERLHGVVGEQLADWLKNLNIIIAVLKDTTLHFTVIGRLHAFLVHRQRIIDILDTSNGAVNEEPSPLKIFTNIVSGQLNLGDTLLFCTTSLLDHLSQEKLKRIMSDQPPADIAHSLESLLGEAEGASSFGALILRLTPEAEKVPEQEEAREYPRAMVPGEQPRDSMEKLIAQERATDTLLNHSLWLNISRFAKNTAESMRTSIGQHAPANSKTPIPARVPAPAAPPKEIERPLFSRNKPPADTTASTAKRVGTVIVRGIGSALGLLFVGIGKGARKIFTRTRRPSFRSTAERLPKSANRGLSRGSHWFQNLSAARRRLLLLAVILILIFAQSIISLGNHQATQKKSDVYLTSLRTANEKIVAADAALLVKNESGARKLLNEASATLATIPEDGKNVPKTEVATARKTIETKMSLIRHVVNAVTASVADLAGLQVGFSASALAATDDTAYTFNTKDSSLYTINIKTKRADPAVSSPSLAKSLLRFVKGASPIDLLQTGGSIVALNAKTSSLTDVPVQYENVDRNVVDATLYNGRLYTLDPRNNQIFRHEKSGTGYGIGQSWIKDVNLDIRDALSLAIDGSLYVLKANGTIDKFTAGKKTATAFDTVDPVLAKPLVLYTDGDTTSVFVLEPTTKRIVEFSKNGAFLRQYHADILGSVVDFVVRKGTIYILTPTQLLSFPVSK